VPPAPSFPRQHWFLVALTLATFFFLLGSRSLNEPDEGRYGEIAREMLETGNWLVPQFWYEPHLDKPPLTYWVEAVSMKLFGLNEWAVRLPLALAGLSGVCAAYLLGCSLGGRRTGWWSAVVLQSSFLYFAMARMLTTDIFLTQFIAWSIYCFWKSWRSLDALPNSDDNTRKASAGKSIAWQLAAWIALAGGFLVKGPVALAIPLAALGGLMICKRRQTGHWRPMLLGLPAGLLLFAMLALPWFWLVFQTVPGAFDYMVKGQAMGHLLGTTIKDRGGFPFYFVVILAAGFLPWSPLLGWLWRRAHWRSLNDAQKEGWVLLSAWTIFTFAFFSFSSAKLAPYILPMFPALAVMVAFRWPGGEQTPNPPPPWVWRAVMISPLLLMAALPLLLQFALDIRGRDWFWPQTGLAVLALAALLFISREWPSRKCVNVAAGLQWMNLFVTVALLPAVETDLKANQTLKPLGLALSHEYRSGDILVCQNFLPQGLPLYSSQVINQTNRPFFCGLAPNRVPFEFPGNRERFGPLILRDDTALAGLLAGTNRVLVASYRCKFEEMQQSVPEVSLRRICKVGLWDLFSNK
jgi:4-amino-4-deoxy-L-arabinose transferase-like glycosyltransferase